MKRFRHHFAASLPHVVGLALVAWLAHLALPGGLSPVTASVLDDQTGGCVGIGIENTTCSTTDNYCYNSGSDSYYWSYTSETTYFSNGSGDWNPPVPNMGNVCARLRRYINKPNCPGAPGGWDQTVSQPQTTQFPTGC
jgi:hypothetical protein